ncbi:MAG: hypothetical protein WCP82_05065 [Alphaproteobacteria bacterium]
MTPIAAARAAAQDPDGQLTKRKSGAWIARNAKPGAPRFDTATVQAAIREGWLKSTPARDGGRITHAVTITPAGQEAT